MTAAMLYLDLLDRGLRLRIDDDDRLIVSPGGKLTARDRVEIRRHKDELMAIVAIDELAPEEGPDTGPAADRTGQPVPSGCLGPTACHVLGACGRAACGVNPDISLPASIEEEAA